MEDYRLHIRAKRKALGFSQKQLACAVNVSQPFIHDIEKSKKASIHGCAGAYLQSVKH